MERMTHQVRFQAAAAAVAGAGVFAVVQLWLLQHPPATPSGIENPGWFLNSGGGVGRVAVAIALAATAAGVVARATPVQVGVSLAAGACVAMVATLAVIGPGDLFPVVIAIGAGIVGLSALAGAHAGAWLRGVRRR